MTSKLKAIMDITLVPIEKGDKVLYLGASHGITAELISKLVGKKGFVFCLDISAEVMETLVKFCEKHENTCPLLFDAAKPEEYKKRVTKVDLIYQDLAQKNQLEIFKRNAKIFLKKDGSFILIIKTQSIDSIKDPSEILRDILKELKDFKIEEVINLNKTHAKHYALVGHQ